MLKWLPELGERQKVLKICIPINIKNRPDAEHELLSRVFHSCFRLALLFIRTIIRQKITLIPAASLTVVIPPKCNTSSI
jgi:hypothetical protein